MSIKVPFRKKSEIEAMALELLSKYSAWKKQPFTPPIDIDEITENYLKISLQLCDLREHFLTPDVLGAIWFDEKIMRIDSSLEEKEGRLVFTMAHEVGHWYMHRPIYEMGKISLPLFGYQQSPPSTAIVCRSAGKKEPAEWQADQFAAMLLMPAELLRATVLSVTGCRQMKIDHLETYRADPVRNPDLRKAARSIIEAGFSNVSIEAMCYRFIDLKLVADTEPVQATLF